MQTFDGQDDEFIHPLWLGILLLFSVVIIIGTLCCLRIKFGSQLRHLLMRLIGRNIETNGKCKQRLLSTCASICVFVNVNDKDFYLTSSR